MAFYINGKKYDTVEGLSKGLRIPLKDFTEKEDATPLRIINITVYKVKWIVPVHFLVFQTADYKWWSLLKCKSSITLKRSLLKNDVIFFDENNVRIDKESVLSEISDKSDKTILDVIEMLKRDSKLFEGYDVLNNNCWIFTKFFFDKLAVVKTFDPLNTKTRARQLIEKILAPFYSWATKTKWKGIFFRDFCLDQGKLVAHGPEVVYSSDHDLSKRRYNRSAYPPYPWPYRSPPPPGYTFINWLKPLYSWATKAKWKGFYFSALCRERDDVSGFIHIAENCGGIENVEEAIKESYSNIFENHSNSVFNHISIQWVSVYKTPLDNAVSNSRSIKKVRDTISKHTKQWTKVDYHAFIALKTSDDVYWSFEKQQDGIYINMKKSLNDVVNNFDNSPRATPVVCIKHTKNTSCTLSRLIKILQNEENSYGATDDSCQHFAKRLYDKISAIDCWEFTRPLEHFLPILLFFSLILLAVLLTYFMYV